MRAKIIFMMVMAAMYTTLGSAENWDGVCGSSQYYHGIGVASTEAEADNAALSDMINSIATNVSSQFEQLDDVTHRDGKVEHNTRVLNCVKTYSQLSLTNVQKLTETRKNGIAVLRYIEKSELDRLFAERADKARNMLGIADECLANKNIDMALQYYYWAYSLLRSVQHPSQVKDEKGKALVDCIPVKIEKILRDLNVECVGKDKEFVELFFTYKGEPVTSLEFTYSDGRTDCQGLVKEGHGMIEMIPGYEADTYHLNIEYQYKNQARGDAEMQSVLEVLTPKAFPKAAFKVMAGNIADKPKHNDILASPSDQSQGSVTKIEGENVPVQTVDSTSLEGENQIVVPKSAEQLQREVIVNVENALKTRHYLNALSNFTPEGWKMFNRLTQYGTSRIIDDSNIRIYPGLKGNAVARGLKMSFSFNGKRKKTFVEDVCFTFNSENKISNVAFGMGTKTENSIFNSRAQWSADVREIILSFMENYKTAYSLERLDYIRDIFADDAVIIIGHVVKRRTGNPVSLDGKALSMKGQDIISTNRYTKNQYIENLKRCFNNNDFINLKFSDFEIQWLDKYEKEQIFAINIRQEYDSSKYSDEGYLFLLVDMTKTDEPLIKVRTWQPNVAPIDQLYHAGYFFND